MAIMPESKVKGGGRLRNDRNGQCWSNLINSACFAPLALPSLHWTNPENFPQQRNLPGSKDITRTPTTLVPKPWSCLHRVIFRTYAWFEMLERTFWCNQFSSRSSAAKVQLDLWNTAAAVLSDLDRLIGSLYCCACLLPNLVRQLDLGYKHTSIFPHHSQKYRWFIQSPPVSSLLRRLLRCSV